MRRLGLGILGKGKLGITDKSRAKTRRGTLMGEGMPESCSMNQSKIVISWYPSELVSLNGALFGVHIPLSLPLFNLFSQLR